MVDQPGSALIDDGTLAYAAVRSYRILDTVPDPSFDDLLAVVVQFAGATEGAITFRELGRTWCKARTDGVPAEWNGAGSGLSVAGSAVIRALDGTQIGELLVFGDVPLDDAMVRTLDVFAALATTLLEERRATGAHVEPWWAVVVGADARLRGVSPIATALLERDHREVRGMEVFDLIHGDDHLIAVESLGRTAAYPGEKYPLDLRFLRSDGSSFLFEVLAMGRDDPSIEDIVFVVKAATKRPNSDAFVSDQARVLAKIGRGAPIVDTLTELAELLERYVGFSTAFMLFNEAAGVLQPVAASGLSDEFVRSIGAVPVGPDSSTCGRVAFRNQADRSADIRTDASWLMHGLDVDVVRPEIASCWCTPIMSSETTAAIGVLALYGTPDRHPRPDEVRVADLCAGIASVAIQRGRAEAALTHLAMHDALTGLPNRALFLDRLQHALSHRPNPNEHVAVMFLDLDRFKIINDALGHDAGDEVLLAVANRLNGVLRPSTTVARFGGDEFTVLCEGVSSPRDAASIAERIAGAFTMPLPLADGEVMMSLSIGVAMTDVPGATAGSLLRDADAAMYRAKERGRNRVEFFDDEMRTIAVARLDLEHALHDAVARGDFSLVFQPQFDLRRGQVVGAEALLRWRHPTRGMVPPADFIAIAEETGAIRQLGEWVLEQACLQTVRFLRSRPMIEAPRDFTMWANLSVVQLLAPGFAGEVQRILDATGVPPACLGLEITESALLTDQDAAIEALATLKAIGVRIAIDDFGTGYSSLSYLKRLPVDVVKIDQSFVDTIVADHRGRAIVHGVVRIAHAVGCRVVAEGVETLEALAVLRDLGCDHGQGFGLAMPAPGSVELPLGLPAVSASAR